MQTDISAARLAAALDRDGLTVALQPLVEIRSGEAARLEALCRWSEPDIGVVHPLRFIPLAESANLITPLTFAVLRRAAAGLPAWRREREGLRVNINLSRSTLLEPDLAGRLAQTLAEAGCDGSALGIEVTESALLLDQARVATALAELRAMGARVEIDDFGTGYSSLGRLIDLPVDAVKIDRRFVATMTRDRRSNSIVRAIIAVAHDLSLEAIAEGVEDRETWELLAALGCDTAQGHHVAPAMPTNEMGQWLASWAAGLEFLRREHIGHGLVAEDVPAGALEVLVVDDEPTIRELIKSVLEADGFRVVTVANGIEALRAIDRGRPSVVLLDMQMPFVDGPAFIRDVRERGLDFPIVVMTAGSSAARLARELRAAGYLSKPFDVARLMDVTRRYATKAA